MGKAKCRCGRQYDVPDDDGVMAIACPACQRAFVVAATRLAGALGGEADGVPGMEHELAGSPAEEDGLMERRQEEVARPHEPAGGRAGKLRRLGDLVVDRALVSREHVELCARIQELLRQQGGSHKRIGEILVEKGLLTAEQLETLLEEMCG